MNKKNDEQTLLLQSQADKAKASVLEKLKRAQEASRDRGTKFTGFPMRFGILAHFAKAMSGVGSKPKAMKASKASKKDSSGKCYDKQDLHLHHLREIMHEHDMPRRKVWNIKLPKTQFKTLFKPTSKDSSPITHHAIVQFPLKEEKELNWENTKIPQPERQYVLTRITDFNKTSR